MSEFLETELPVAKFPATRAFLSAIPDPDARAYAESYAIAHYTHDQSPDIPEGWLVAADDFVESLQQIIRYFVQSDLS